MIFTVYRKDLQTGESKKIGSSDSNLVAMEIMMADASPRWMQLQLMSNLHCISKDVNKSVFALDVGIEERYSRYEYTILTE